MKFGALLSISLVSFVLFSGRSTHAQGTGQLEGWKWKGTTLKNAPQGSPQNNLWNKLCALYSCMPPELVKKSGIKKEDVTVFNVATPEAEKAGWKKSKTFHKGGNTEIAYAMQDLIHSNIYIAKFVVFEELWHSTQSDVYPAPDASSNPSSAQVDLALTNDGYAEVEARLKAAGYVGPMQGKQPASSPVPDQQAQQRFDEEAKETVKRALAQMCKSYDNIKNTSFTGTKEKKAQSTFKKCKEAGASFVANC